MSYWRSRSISNPPHHKVICVRCPAFPSESRKEPKTVPPLWFPHDTGATTIFSFDTHKEKQSFCKANPITKCLRNSGEDKGKPDRTSRYRMKLYHHSARNRHGMSTHSRRVRADQNRPRCTTSVCAVYIALHCSDCRLNIPIGTQTVPLLTGGHSTSGLSIQASTPTECPAWQAITNCRR